MSCSPEGLLQHVGTCIYTPTYCNGKSDSRNPATSTAATTTPRLRPRPSDRAWQPPRLTLAIRIEAVDGVGILPSCVAVALTRPSSTNVRGKACKERVDNLSGDRKGSLMEKSAFPGDGGRERGAQMDAAVKGIARPDQYVGGCAQIPKQAVGALSAPIRRAPRTWPRLLGHVDACQP